MGGLGAGALLLGPRADRARDPLRLYARLEVGIALAAAATPALVLAVRALYFALGGSEALGFAGGTAVRLALSVAVLGLPAFWMGGTLPAAVRAISGGPAGEDRERRGVGLLYGANTLGAVAGALVATFLALEHLGIRGTIWTAALLNLAVAAAAFGLAGKATGGADVREAAPPERPEPPGERAAPLGLVLTAAALAGFAFFVMELVWYRMLAPILGGTSYTFGLILAVALLGIGAGGLLYGARPRPTLAGFALTCALEAVALAVPFALGDRIALLALRWIDPAIEASGGAAGGGFAVLVVAWALVTAVVVLPAALVAGYQFPLLVGVLGRGRRAVGKGVGLAYGWNTAGAIAGSIGGGFGLLPLLTAPGTWRATVALLAALAFTAAAVASRRSDGGEPGRAGASATALGATVLLGVVGLALAAAPGPTAFWRHSGIGAGRFGEPPATANGTRAEIRAARADLLWEAEGLESSVALVGSAGYSFLVNGKSDGSALGDAGTQVMGGLIGSMLHPEPKTALVIGLGTGSTAGWLAEVPSIERVDVVELEPAILRVAEWCAPVNHDVLDHPKVEVIVGDGRELLLTTNQRWDVIFSEPSNPYRAGISSLFSQELYRAARARLADGGLFLQWLQGYEVDASVVRTAYATLGSVFDSVESWQTLSQDLLLVASAAPLVHDWERVERRAGEEPYRSALPRTWGVEGAAGFYSGFVGGPELARDLVTPATPIHTDDRPVIEFGFARNLGQTGGFEIEELARRAQELGIDRLGVDRPQLGDGREGEDGRWRLAEDARLARGAFFSDLPARPPGLPRAAHRARQAYLHGEWADVRASWERQGRLPRHRVDRVALARALAYTAEDGGEGSAAFERARELARALDATVPAESEALLALIELYDDNPRTAAFYLDSLFRRLRTDPWIQPDLLSVAFRMAIRLGEASPALAQELYAALEEPFAVGLADHERLATRLNLAAALPEPERGSGGEPACVEVFAELEPWVAWTDDMLSARVSCYTEADSPLLRRALRDLAAYRENATPEEAPTSEDVSAN